MIDEEIVILGGNLSGLLMALALAHHKIPVTVLEKSAYSESLDNRAIALTHKSQQFFAQINLWPKIQELIGKIHDIYVIDNKYPHYLHLDQQLLVRNEIGYIISSKEFKRLLIELVVSNHYITLRHSSGYLDLEHLGADKTILSLSDGGYCSAELVIVCDGIFSKLRSRYFGYLINKDYQQSALVFDIEHTNAHEGTAVEHFLTRGPFAILPLRNPYHSSIVWTEPTELAPLYATLPVDDLAIQLRSRVGEALGALKIISKVQIFPIIAQLTDKYYHQNLVLIGDAAHALHPLAGQGLNQTIKDIAKISTEIATQKKFGLPVNNPLMLEEYQRARRLDNLATLATLDLINLVFSNNYPVVQQLRKLGLQIVNKIGPIKRWLIS